MKTKSLYFLFSLICLSSLWMGGCQHYPYNTRQAKLARRAESIAAAEKKALQKAKERYLRDSIAIAKMYPVSANQPVENTGNKREPSVPIPNNPEVIVLPTGKGKFNDSLATMVGAREDSIKTDSIKNDSIAPEIDLPVAYANDSIDAVVEYESADSMLYNVAQKKVYLWGKASVKYKTMRIKAAYIVFDFNTKIATAEYRTDSTGAKYGEPEFKDGEQEFVCSKMIYNFETRKGKVIEALTKEGEGLLHSSSTKFSGKGPEQKEDVIFSKACLYTTCDAPEPHFGIRASRAKIIPNKLIVVGPSYLEIMGLPTPLALPFGFFPVTQKRRSGLLFPKDFESNPGMGFGLKNVGWYFGGNDHVDFSLTGDIYLSGSWGVYASSNYNVKHKSNGNIRFSTNTRINGQPNTREYTEARAFNISWSHNQDQSAHPYNRFSASLNLGTGTYFQAFSNNAAQRTNQTLVSSVNFTRTFPRSPISLTAGMSHSQDVNLGTFQIVLPTLALNVNQMQPFKRKKAVGKERWYEKITFAYSSQFNNTLSTRDDVLFSDKWAQTVRDKSNFGIQHNPNLSMTFKLFKVLNVNPSINYSSQWYFYHTKKTYDALRDTMTEARVYKFEMLHNLSAGVNVSTMLYSSLNFRKGPIRAIRHTITPTIGFNWRPDYEDPFWNLFDSVRLKRVNENLVRYNRFEGGVFGAPGGGKSGSINFGVNNVFEAKVVNPRDSTGQLKKISLLPQLSINGNYNLFADSLNLSNISFSSNARLFKLINLNVSGSFDAYQKINNRRVNTFLITKGDFLRLERLSFTASTSLDPNSLSALVETIFGGKKAAPKPEEKESKDKKKDNPFSLLQNTSISYSLLVTPSFNTVTERDTVAFAQALSINGALNLSPKWVASYSFAYDFVNKRIAYPTMNLERNLHCWQMGINWQIEARMWTFYLRVKAPSLSFINIPATKNFFDTY